MSKRMNELVPIRSLSLCRATCSCIRPSLPLLSHPIMTTLPPLPTRIIRSTYMLLHIRLPHPLTPILLKRLNPRLELRLLQREIINRANAWNTHTRRAAAAPVHERAADAAEAIFHVVAGSDGGVLAEAGQEIFAARVMQVGITDDEVGGEHAGRVR